MMENELLRVLRGCLSKEVRLFALTVFICREREVLAPFVAAPLLFVSLLVRLVVLFFVPLLFPDL